MKIVKPILVCLGLLWTVIGVNAGDCSAAGAPGGDLGPEYNQPLGATLEALILPEIDFRDSDLAAALQYLGQKARTQSDGAIQVQFVLLLPDDFKPRYELTLDLKSISFARALQYVGQLAGVKFTAGPHAIIARVAGPLPPQERQAATPGPARPPDITHTAADFKGPLDNPAVPVPVGNNLWVTGDDGADIDGSRSGYVAHRGLDGKPIELDPLEKDPMSTLEIDRDRAWRRSWTKPKAPHPISPLVQGWLDSVTYLKLDFDKLPLDSCIEWLQKSSAKQTGKGPGVNFVLDRGVDAGEPITLHLTNVPLLEALRYLSAVSGVEFSLDQYAISVKSAPSGGGLGMPEPATPEEINELESVTLPGLELNHTPLDGVMQSLSRNTFSISNGKMQLCFVTEPGLNASVPVTLNVTNMPLTEALQYIGELANVDFVFQRYGIWVRRKTARD
jgi:hypothetical protein